MVTFLLSGVMQETPRAVLGRTQEAKATGSADTVMSLIWDMLRHEAELGIAV